MSMNGIEGTEGKEERESGYRGHVDSAKASGYIWRTIQAGLGGLRGVWRWQERRVRCIPGVKPAMALGKLETCLAILVVISELDQRPKMRNLWLP